jgi:hypothetical protein
LSEHSYTKRITSEALVAHQLNFAVNLLRWLQLLVFSYHPEIDDERERFEIAHTDLAAASFDGLLTYRGRIFIKSSG